MIPVKRPFRRGGQIPAVAQCRADAVSRGGAPGTLYTIEPDLDTITENETSGIHGNAHGLDPLQVLAAVKRAGARLGRVFVVGCEPALLEDDTGRIGLTEKVEAAVDPAIDMIRFLIFRKGDLR